MSDNIGQTEIESLSAQVTLARKSNKILCDVISKMMDRLDQYDIEFASMQKKLDSVSSRISVNDHILCH